MDRCKAISLIDTLIDRLWLRALSTLELTNYRLTYLLLELLLSDTQLVAVRLRTNEFLDRATFLFTGFFP